MMILNNAAVTLVSILLLQFGRHHVVANGQTCINVATGEEIENCPGCHPSCATCGILGDNTDNIGRPYACLSCTKDGDEVIRRNENDDTGICPGGCREQTQAVETCDGILTCLEDNLPQNNFTCAAGVASLCTMANPGVCDPCQTEAQALKECMQDLTIEEVQDLPIVSDFILVAIAPECADFVEVPEECIIEGGPLSDSGSVSDSVGVSDSDSGSGSDTPTPLSSTSDETSGVSGVANYYFGGILSVAIMTLWS